MITAAKELEKERVSLATYIYKMLGTFMGKYSDDPSEICRFFNFNMLKNPAPEKETEFGGEVEAGKTVTIVQSNFNKDSIFTIENTGPTDLKFCLAENADEETPNQGVTVQPGMMVDITGMDLGNFIFKFFNVKNLNTAGPGSYLVTLID
ncbi:MAG: hypothetical protein WCJ01_10445 [Ignavibacteria bacterium]